MGKKTKVNTPTSERQIESNRCNASHSSGPKTPEGKAKVSKNALKLGMCMKQFTVLPGESQAMYDDLQAMLMMDQDPQGPLEVLLVIQLAQSMWVRARGLHQENRIAEDPVYRDVMQTEISRVAGYRLQAERSVFRHLRELRILRKERGAGPRVALPDEDFMQEYILDAASLDALLNVPEPLPQFPDLPSQQELIERATVQRIKSEMRRGHFPFDNHTYPQHLVKLADISLGTSAGADAERHLSCPVMASPQQEKYIDLRFPEYDTRSEAGSVLPMEPAIEESHAVDPGQPSKKHKKRKKNKHQAQSRKKNRQR